jgi:hypothetical protein
VEKMNMEMQFKEVLNQREGSIDESKIEGI